MKYLSIKNLSLLLLIMVGLASCKKDEMPADLNFKKVIDTGGTFNTPTESSDVVNTEGSMYDDGTHIWSCTTQTLDVSAASGGSSGFPLFDVGSDVIYPGSMLQGNSLNSGNPNPIVVERAGGTVSINILDGNLVSSFEVEQVKKSTITNAINNIIANATGTLPANFNIKVESVQSREEFALALGVDVNSTFVELESNLNYNYDSEKSSFLVSLNQSYYTMSFDLPTSLDQLFAPSVTPEDLAIYVGPNNPATYISSVTYGRIFYMLIESSSSQSELDIAVRGAFNGVTTDVDATLDITNFNSVDNVTYSVFAYGGDAGPTFGAVGVTDINQLTDILSQSSSLGSAKSLSYVVRSVANNQVVATQLATTYDVVECEISGAIGTIPSIQHWTGHYLFDDFGPVTGAYSEGNSKFILFNEEGDYLRSTFVNGEGLLEGPFSLSFTYPLNSVGAACKFEGEDVNSLLFLDATGTQYTIYEQGAQTWSTPKPLSDYTYNFSTSHPFSLVGASAVAYYPDGTFTTPGFPITLGTGRNMWFSNSGQDYAFNYLANQWNPWSDVNDLYQDWGGGVLNGNIVGVGAAIGFEINQDYFNILFNEAGDQYVLRGNINGNGAELAGPYNL